MDLIEGRVLEGAEQRVRFWRVFLRRMFLRKVLSGELVSGWVCTSTKIVFLFLPFSLERKRKKQGEPTNGSPLTPFQRSTGTLSPSIAPAQWDECPLLVNFCSNVPRGRKAKEGEKRRKLPGAGKVAGCRNFGRKRERLQAAHRRAALGVNCAGRISRF